MKMSRKLRNTLDRYVKYSSMKCEETELGIKQFINYENGVSEPNAGNAFSIAC